MNKLKFIGLAIASIITLAGCAGTSANKINGTALVSKIAAKDATFYALEQHPEWRPKFDAALVELNTLADAEKIDVKAVVAIINRLPVKEIQGKTARLIISDVQIVVQELAPNSGEVISEERYANTRTVVRGIRDGIVLGLAMGLPDVPPAPPVPPVPAVPKPA